MPGENVINVQYSIIGSVDMLPATAVDIFSTKLSVVWMDGVMIVHLELAFRELETLGPKKPHARIAQLSHVHGDHICTYGVHRVEYGYICYD